MLSIVLATWLSTNLNHQHCKDTAVVKEALVEYGIPDHVDDTRSYGFVMGWNTDDHIQMLQVITRFGDGFEYCESNERTILRRVE